MNVTQRRDDNPRLGVLTSNANVELSDGKSGQSLRHDSRERYVFGQSDLSVREKERFWYGDGDRRNSFKGGCGARNPDRDRRR